LSTAILRPRSFPADPKQPPASRGVLGWAERSLLPDALIRHGIRRLCAARLRAERAGGLERQAARFEERIELLRRSPIAIHTDAANAQHYELPPAFFEACLGRRLKYSCAYYPRGNETLDEAEEAMLELYAERAQLKDGQRILELGCGWGSLTLWMAERFPNARIEAVSNSRPQREFIEARCASQGIRNVTVRTADVNGLDLAADAYDRCVSVEMFEHVRNYRALLRRIARSLSPGGKLFVHIFAHRTLMYPFETSGEDDWMGRYFFTGGLMPATETLPRFQEHLEVEAQWLLDGTHYQRTAEHWLANHDAHRDAVMIPLRAAYGADAALWNQRWRMFWMACAELFGYAGGQEWVVAHYRFARCA
jgi:cyclopropane-fatty-acyl-phospholipid synthase